MSISVHTRKLQYHTRCTSVNNLVIIAQPVRAKLEPCIEHTSQSTTCWAETSSEEASCGHVCVEVRIASTSVRIELLIELHMRARAGKCKSAIKMPQDTLKAC